MFNLSEGQWWADLQHWLSPARAAEALLSLLFPAQEQEIGSANETWVLPQGSAEHYL